jgi:hypothetical protein
VCAVLDRSSLFALTYAYVIMNRFTEALETIHINETTYLGILTTVFEDISPIMKLLDDGYRIIIMGSSLVDDRRIFRPNLECGNSDWGERMSNLYFVFDNMTEERSLGSISGVNSMLRQDKRNFTATHTLPNWYMLSVPLKYPFVGEFYAAGDGTVDAVGVVEVTDRQIMGISTYIKTDDDTLPFVLMERSVPYVVFDAITVNEPAKMSVAHLRKYDVVDPGPHDVAHELVIAYDDTTKKESHCGFLSIRTMNGGSSRSGLR